MKTQYERDIFKLKEKNRMLAKRAWQVYGLQVGL
jgi:hypothetical protein